MVENSDGILDPYPSHEKMRQFEALQGVRLIISNGKLAISGVLNGTTTVRNMLTVFLRDPRAVNDDLEAQQIITNARARVQKDPILRKLWDIHLNIHPNAWFSAETEDWSERIEF